jgi:septal ring factor EnvC (AmiA/AmiB activator)
MYGKRLRALYKMSRNGYAAVIFASAGQGDTIKQIKYLAMITERDRIMIRDYAKALDSLEVQQADIAKKREAFLERKRGIEIKKAELDTRKQRKASLLASVREEKGLYEQSLRELEESSASLWTMIKKAERERKTARAAQTASAPVRSGIDQSRLPWPLEGQVLTRFGEQRHPQFKTMVFRHGIEIAAREGEPVYAVGNGQVAFADWYKGYGKLMIIEHDSGFYTLYGNLSRVDLARGERVQKGQMIGLAGETGSLKGSKLYFEIRRNGEAQDPLLWLAKR